MSASAGLSSSKGSHAIFTRLEYVGDRPRRIHPCGEAWVKVARRAGRADNDPEVLARLDDGS
jgi:hypothetical protein